MHELALFRVSHWDGTLPLTLKPAASAAASKLEILKHICLYLCYYNILLVLLVVLVAL